MAESQRQFERFEATVDEPIQRRLRASLRTPEQSIAMFELPTFEMQRVDEATGQVVEPSVSVEEILAEARATAAEMVEQARAARDAELAAGWREGFEKGRREGAEAIDRELSGQIAAAEAIAQHVAHEREQILAGSEGDVVELAIAIARRIVGAAIDVNPDLVVEACRGAMRKAFQRDTLVVLAHPDDLALLRQAGPEMAQQMGGVHHLDFVEERRLDRGSVVVRTPAGEIDATIDAKRERIEAELREAVEERRASGGEQAAA